MIKGGGGGGMIFLASKFPPIFVVPLIIVPKFPAFVIL